MITFEAVTVVHDGAAAPALPVVNAHIPEGELCLLVGPSGAGKSTLLGTVPGLVPHFTGGTLHGRVTVAGRDTRTHKPRELADVVGTVGQDPLAHFVTDTVEDELAYGMESLGLPPGTMRRRVEETLDLLGLNELRDRPIATLSGGQQQRVAIGSVLTPHPRVLVLDEPTSALDPAAAEEVLAVLQRLVHDLGTTVLMAEHRLERVVQYADQVLLLAPEGEGAGGGVPGHSPGGSPPPPLPPPPPPPLQTHPQPSPRPPSPRRSARACLHTPARRGSGIPPLCWRSRLYGRPSWSWASWPGGIRSRSRCGTPGAERARSANAWHPASPMRSPPPRRSSPKGPGSYSPGTRSRSRRYPGSAWSATGSPPFMTYLSRCTPGRSWR